MFFNTSSYKPKFTFVTASFGNERHHICASRLIETVRLYVTSNIHCLTNDNLRVEICRKYLDILKKYNIDIESSFIWKPWLILSQLEKISKNGILFYLDAGSEISKKKIAISELDRLFHFASNKGSIFFKNNYDSVIRADKESLNILNNYIRGANNTHHSIAAGAFILRNDRETNFIIKKWCYLTLIKSGSIFKGNNNPYHRHDQVVLSALLYKFNEGINILKYPIWFDNFLYFYPSILNYPIHNNRNKTNISYIGSFNFLKKIFFLRIFGYYGIYDYIFKVLYFLKKK